MHSQNAIFIISSRSVCLRNYMLTCIFYVSFFLILINIFISHRLSNAVDLSTTLYLFLLFHMYLIQKPEKTVPDLITALTLQTKFTMKTRKPLMSTMTLPSLLLRPLRLGLTGRYLHTDKPPPGRLTPWRAWTVALASYRWQYMTFLILSRIKKTETSCWGIFFSFFYCLGK